MVRGKQTATAQAATRRAAATKAATEKKDEDVIEIKEDEDQVEEVGEQDDAMGEGEQDETLEEGDQSAEGHQDETLGEGEQVEGEEATEAGAGASKDREPLTEEENAYIAEILQTKVKTSEDTESFVFSYGPPKLGQDGLPLGFRPIVCHLCRIASLQRPTGIKAHLSGRRHSENIKRKTINAERFKQPYYLFYSREGNKVKQFKINPGENIETVTPEYEDRIVDQLEWKFKKIDGEKLITTLSKDPIIEYNKARPVIGLDYIVKFRHKKQIKAFCCLCDMFTIDDIYQHVTHIKHQANYIIKHFPGLYERVVKEVTIKNPRIKEKAIRDIFRKLYRKIEIKHGFKTIIPVDGTDFHNFRNRYTNKIRKEPHYDEKSLEFTDAEVAILIKKSNNNIPFNEPDPPRLPKPGSEAFREALVRRRTNPQAIATRRNPPLSETEADKWDKYRSIKSKRVERLAAQYKKYEKNPKLHPSYQKEWSEFWHARCEQLKKENVDPDTYNFDTEWLPHWQKRLRKLYNQDISERRTALRTKFDLPTGRRTPSPTTLARSVRSSMNKPSPRIMSRRGPMSPMGGGGRGPMGGGGGRGPMGGGGGRGPMGGGGGRGPMGPMGGSGGGRRRGGPDPQNFAPNYNANFMPPQMMNMDIDFMPNQPNPNFGRIGVGGIGPMGADMMGGIGGIGSGGNRNMGMGGGGGGSGQQQFGNMRSQQQRPIQQKERPQPLQQQQQQQSRKRKREPVTVISVLRLLTALEDQLGSLGPKSVQLLSKAVLCEKNNQSPKDLLADNDYYVLFATAKEKLKGQVIAGVLEGAKAQAGNRAIDDVTTVLASMEKEIRSRNAKNNSNQQNSGGPRSGSGGGGSGGGLGITGNIPGITLSVGGDGANDNFGRGNANMGGGGGGDGFIDDRNANNNNFGNSGNFRGNAGGNFGGNGGGGGGGNFRSSNDQFNSSDRDRNFGNSSNNVNEGNYRGGFGGNDGATGGRMGSSFDGANNNYRSNDGDGGNYRSMGNNNNNDGGNNYRGGNFGNDSGNFRSGVGNTDSGNYRGSNDGGLYRGSNDGGNFRGSSNDDGNYRGSNDGGNYRSSNDGGNFRGNNLGTGSGGGGTGGGSSSGNFGSGSMSNYRGNDSGNYGGNSSFGSNTGTGGNKGISSGFGGSNYSTGGGGTGAGNQYRGTSNDNFKSQSSFGISGGGGGGSGGNSAAQNRGSWMGGSGSVYSSINSKSNTNTPAFSSGLGGISSQPKSLLSFDARNSSSSFNTGSSNSANFRRFH